MKLAILVVAVFGFVAINAEGDLKSAFRELAKKYPVAKMQELYNKNVAECKKVSDLEKVLSGPVFKSFYDAVTKTLEYQEQAAVLNAAHINIGQAYKTVLSFMLGHEPTAPTNNKKSCLREYIHSLVGLMDCVSIKATIVELEKTNAEFAKFRKTYSFENVKNFWKLVAKKLPEYETLKAELAKYDIDIGQLCARTINAWMYFVTSAAASITPDA